MFNRGGIIRVRPIPFNFPHKIAFVSPCTSTTWHQGNHFVRDPAVNLTKIHGLEFIKWVGQEAWCDSPANTGEPKKKQKLAPYKMHAPSLFPGPKPNHLISLCLIRMVGLEICLTCTCPTFPGKPRNLFSKKKHAFYKMTRKKPYKMPPFCKNALGMEHGSSHFIVEIYTGMFLWNVHVHFDGAGSHKTLAPGFVSGLFPGNFPNKMALVKCPCASRLLIQTCRQETLGSFYRDRAKLLRDLSWRSSAGICKRSLTPTELL